MMSAPPARLTAPAMTPPNPWPQVTDPKAIAPARKEKLAVLFE